MIVSRAVPQVTMCTEEPLPLAQQGSGRLAEDHVRRVGPVTRAGTCHTSGPRSAHGHFGEHRQRVGIEKGTCGCVIGRVRHGMNRPIADYVLIHEATDHPHQAPGALRASCGVARSLPSNAPGSPAQGETR